MSTVKQIREERSAEPTREKLAAHLKHYFSVIEKLTVGEDAAFRSELKKYSEALGMSTKELNDLCAASAPKA